ncbi:hypothetical protein SERLA73DRAFT_187763 [Serpula lacrymans var. lacrymans S7.3]|uniref:Uncharacterized protein n=2 Tax=Serpula lacrymans var. lacrymans TaxID=341189 RepID=F8QAB6_SERL3|nr:uncharacterized protein SERLADRAFT_477549 [Serpula lacrymans var. lacrymans S7.9]EGN94706.1 hypothetical protein SERLA73DRAFT_187763 [Serpula lacrymans var. lacrymans S7.3]EGO20184.1 hypothetical protein SERLADRAFT_477549 [Serpula lacrymans var. lacrymans S7.9]
MCLHEIVGDYYRGCGHFHGRYFTGEMSDCNASRCKTSKSHMHKTAPNCGCPSVVTEDRRVQNLYQTPHPDCHRVR